MVIAHVEVFEGPIKEVTPTELEAVQSTAASAPERAEPPELDLGEVSDELRPKLQAVLDRYKSVWHGSLGSIKKATHRIVLRPGATPVRQHLYKAGPRTREIEKEQVELMQSMGVIEPSTSEWASPVVIVPKPGGRNTLLY